MAGYRDTDSRTRLCPEERFRLTPGEKGFNTMSASIRRFVLTALLLATTPALALAVPVMVGTASGGPQSVIMCPNCGQPIACAQVGDYGINFAVDSLNAKTGATRLNISLVDRTGRPVTGAKVALVLDMPAHHHGPITVPVSGGRKGVYTAATNLSPHMRGQWTAEVRITTPKGDTVSQAFTFEQ